MAGEYIWKHFPSGKSSVVAKSWTDVADGVLEGAAVVHDGQWVGERVQGGEEEAEAHPSGKSWKEVNIEQQKPVIVSTHLEVVGLLNWE